LDSKKVMSALMIVIFLAGMANAAAASSSTPPTSHLSINVYVGQSGNYKGFAQDPLVYINSTNGHFTESMVGNTLNESLVYGNYTITVMPTQSVDGGIDYITNKTTTTVQLYEPDQSLNIGLTYSKEVYSGVLLHGLNGHTVTVSFSTTTGYQFFTKTTNVSSFNTTLPSTGLFYSNIYVSGNPSSQVTQILSLPTSRTISVYLNSTSVNVFGNVYNKTSGARITSYKLVEYNALSSLKYTVLSYDQPFAASGQTGTEFYIVAPGYAPARVSPGSHSIGLTTSTSYINTTYELSSNLHHLSVVTHYDITVGSFPGIANSSVMNLSLQFSMDTNFADQVMKYITDLPNNTYYTFLANSSYYNFTNAHYAPVSTPSGTGVNVYEYSNYTNINMDASDYKNLKLNVFQKGTKYTPVAIDYATTIMYTNSSVSVASASSPITYGNPFQILPVNSNSWIQVTFGKAQNPYFVDSNARTYFKGVLTSSSILNSTAKNMVVMVPKNEQFSLNMSGTLYNPLVGAYQTNSPASFTWEINGHSYTGSNLSYNKNNLTMTYNTITNITLTGTDYSGFSNVTHIHIIPVTTSPAINVTYSVSGKTYNLTSAETASGSVSISIPQNTVVVFDASGSTMNFTFKGVTYSAPLHYAWSFPNYTTVGSTINYKFTEPYLTVGLQNGYLNVTSAANTTSRLIFKATVNDTTLPSSVLTIQKDGKNITAIPAATPFVVTANYSSYKYADFNKLSFLWVFEYGNGSAIPFNSTNLTVISHSGSVVNESTWLKVQINLVAKIYISLKVTSNNLSAYDNVSYTTTYSGPKLLVTGVYYTGSFSQGVKKQVQVNVTNRGSAKVDNETIMVYDNSKLVGSSKYNTILAVNQSSVFFVNVTLTNSGSQSLSFQAYNSLQPNFVQKNEALTHTASVSVSSDRVVLVIVVIIVIIIILALLYVRMTRGKFTRAPRNTGRALPTSGQSSQKKISDPKQPPSSKQ
jgi:hypothetical protein